MKATPPNFSMCINYAFTTYNNLACWNGLNGPYMQKSSLFVINVSSCWVSRVLSLKIPMPDKSSLPYFPWPFLNSIQGSSMVVKEDGLGFEQQSLSTSILGSNHFECPRGPIFESRLYHAQTTTYLADYRSMRPIKNMHCILGLRSTLNTYGHDIDNFET